MTSSPRHYQYYLVMGPDFYGSVVSEIELHNMGIITGNLMG